jgi:speckle-type POZ protein
MAESSPSPIVSGSTCTPQTARGTHLFKIDGYSLYMGLGVGECINSATFAVGGYDWGIDFYPDGATTSRPRNDGTFVQALLQTASKSMYKRHILLSAPNPALGNGSFAEVPAIL